MVAIEARDRGAAGTRSPFVARGPRRISIVRATRALQDVSTEGCHIAKLRAGGELQALRNDGVPRYNGRMLRHRRHLGKGSQSKFGIAEFDFPAPIRLA